MKRLIQLLILIFFPLVLAAQGGGGDLPGQAFRTLYGKAVDARTGDPVAFASVRIEDSGLSNVTNAEGFFSLKIPGGTPDAAAISIQHLGYQSAVRSVAQFQGSTAGQPLLLPLVPVSLALDPSVIRSIDPHVLLNTAYRHVKDNYPQQHEHLTSFYRELIRKGSKYLVLNEAIVDVDKAPYSGFQSDRAAIYKGRGSKNFQAADSLFVKFQGGITGTLRGDIVKDPFIGTSLASAPDYYTMSIEGSTTLDGRDCIILAFHEKPGQEEILFDGRLFIDSESFAIARVEYGMNVKGREAKAATRFVVKKPADWKIDVDKAHYTLNFKPFGGRWHFDYSRLDLVFNARRKRSLFRHSYSVLSEMAVTDIREETFSIPNQQKVKFNDILSEQVSDFTDPDFWGSYNIIEPDQTIDAAIRRIIRQLKNRKNP
ncbi:MAG: carboxypeptidase-like regulatory domain-containing protein [Bacteroidales bacterium]|nr:carboxypeptidase-like regulatory domain-containing protein [Bacteroidales bacterium]